MFARLHARTADGSTADGLTCHSFVLCGVLSDGVTDGFGEGLTLVDVIVEWLVWCRGVPWFIELVFVGG